MAKRKTLQPFRHRNFRVLFPANVLSNIGTWAQRIAQDWLVLQLTHSPTALGIVTALQFAPTLVFSTWGGVLADRFDKRYLLFISNAGAGIVSLVLGLLVEFNQVNIWWVYLLALLLGIFSALDAPIRQTFTSELVGQDDIAGAIALNSINFNIGRLIGPGLSGLMIAAFGTGPSFLFNALSYVTMLISLGMIRTSELQIASQEKTKVKLKDAIDYFRSRTDLKIVLFVAFMGSTFGMNYQIFNALMATQEFHKGPAEFGGLGTFLAVGSLLGALVTTRTDSWRNPRRITIGVVLFGIAIAVLAASPNYEIFSLQLPIGGTVAIIALVSANSYIQTTTDPAIRGRIMGIYMMVLMGGTPVGSPVLGWIADVLGIRLAMVIFGLITALGSATVFLVLSRGTDYRRRKPE